GRISREKGIATGLRAARRANVAPVVIGEIYDEAYYRGDVLPELRGTTLQPSMPRAAVRALMARAAVTVMPVEWDEPFGLVAAAVPPRAYGGIELFVAVLARQLVAKGHAVTVYATGDSRPAGRLRYRFAEPIWPPDYSREREHCAFAWDDIAREGADIVHLN